MTVRLGAEGDIRECLALRAGWATNFLQRVPAELCWCPAGGTIPQLEDEDTIRASLSRSQAAVWGMVWEETRHIGGYLLCRDEQDGGRFTLVSPSPRIVETADYLTVGRQLIACALREGARRGLQQAQVNFHGPTAEIASLTTLYRSTGFTAPSCDPRLEMIRHRSQSLPEYYTMELHSAADIGEAAFFAADAMIRGCSPDESRENLAMSQRMWLIDPHVDWILAFRHSEIVGLIETAVTRTGIGVIDHLEVIPSFRHQGIGRALLIHALAHLAARTEYTWLDVDRDNAPATRLYQQVGFMVHHEHGRLTRGVRNVK